MNCTFYRPETANIKEFENIIGKLRYDLHVLETEKNDEWNVYNYIYTLCQFAQPLDHNPQMVFLGLDEPDKMPSDARIAYFYLPTYIATAFVMKAVLLFPSLMNETTFLDSELDFSAAKVKVFLASLMLGCTGRGFDGSDVFSMKDLVKLFEDAGASEFLNKYSDLCPEFTNLYFECLEQKSHN